MFQETSPLLPLNSRNFGKKRHLSCEVVQEKLLGPCPVHRKRERSPAIIAVVTSALEIFRPKNLRVGFVVALAA